MSFSFFAAMSRLKYIERWALMRNSRAENLSEHSLEVSMLAHAIAGIGRVRYGRTASIDRAAVLAMYHDASEIITGDLPTPVKYYSRQIKEAYREVERRAERQLLKRLPADLRPLYQELFFSEDSEEERYLRSVVKAADRLSAYIKCIEEERAGNTEFRSAKQTIWEDIQERQEQLPELRDFLRDFLPSYGRTLDELELGAQADAGEPGDAGA
ncbi:5'-deoxynucleotidase [Oribacterium sp. oral taxon 102]|uniref:5'-deoxynucleotidase n=1 Tax=Oribacterium sp. oral taxon 102 TaxID=671214 RepID=UPI0015B7F2B6|nr:5'-deoxynucleotidase [Oribacterium sp. oral taxon 102]NWO21210.1 5'-deoxynucleotidase [Oribacterium sp. oral taxon 102]